MVEIVRELGKGAQVLYAYQRNDLRAKFRPYPMRLVTYTHPTDSVHDQIKAAREPSGDGYKIDVMIHCNDAEGIRDRLIAMYGLIGVAGRQSKWITCRPINIITSWLDVEIPRGLTPHKQLVLIRRLMNVTQKELGIKTGMSNNHISQLEKHGMSAAKQLVIAKGLGVEIGLRP